MAVHYAPAGKDVKGENGLVLKVEQTGRGLAQSFATKVISKGVCVLASSGFGEAGRGMFIHHCASANAAPILMRT